jgi:hypothetical protein
VRPWHSALHDSRIDRYRDAEQVVLENVADNSEVSKWMLHAVTTAPY